jgi:hypothetical protein
LAKHQREAANDALAVQYDGEYAVSRGDETFKFGAEPEKSRMTAVSASCG